MLLGTTVLIVFQLAGEIAAYFIGGMIPGPVIGMVLIAVVLAFSARMGFLRAATEKTCDTSKLVLANLGLLFVPAGVGIVKHVDLILARGPALVAVVILSTTITLIVTVWVFLLVKRLTEGSPHD